MARRRINLGSMRLGLAALLLTVAVLPAGAAASRAFSVQEQMQPAGALMIPPTVEKAIGQIYAGDPAAAIAAAEKFESEHPKEPLGYLLEAEARWWQLYCQNNQIRYGMVDVWELPKLPEEKPYLNAAKTAVKLAEDELAAKKPGALAHLWAGMGYAFEARLYGLRGEKMATARAGVKARTALTKALELDPQLADADTGLGLYNYYVDTLSPVVKLLRFFLGIPGGSKKEGVRQLRTAMEHGKITAVEARFYLAKNLRTYDHNYAEALRVAGPLARQYPDNPIFLLLIGNLEMELGRKDQAKEILGRIDPSKIPDAACAARSRSLAQELLGEK